jgi:hypothetical protein
MKYQDLIRKAVKRLDEAATADLPNRERSEGDLTFVIGEGQWPEEIRRQREDEGKPCLTLNRLPQFVRQVTGQIRQINPAIRVIPAGSEATDDIAEIYEGLIRQIEAQSDASSIYEQTAESAAACGIGHFRVRADYCDDNSFDQELLIERIPNPFAVFWDPLAKHSSRSDAGYCFIIEEMDLEDFKAAYPDRIAEDVTSENRPADLRRWFTPDTVAVAEYYWIEYEEYEIGLTPDGQVIRDPRPPMNFVRKRKVKAPKVKWAKITGAEVLEGPTDIPARQIPVFAVTGEEWHMGEEMYRSSVIRFAKDAQQLYNYGRSAHAEIVALQPKAPYMVTPRQVAGLEEIWGAANRSNAPYLPYNPDPAAPPPQRSTPPVPSPGLMQEIGLSIEDLKATTGVYDASLGNRSNETSGVAIAQRQQESQVGTSIYADNMVKSIHQCGKVLVQMIPAIYDTARVIRILGEDDQEKQVRINEVMMDLQGRVEVNDLTVGKYDVRVTSGPSYDTKREAASDGMLSFIQAYPPAAAVTADLVAKAQDWPDADKFAERLRKTLPPGVIEIEDMDPEQQQQVQAAQQQAQQMEQMQQQMMMMQQQLQMAELEAKTMKLQADAAKTGAEADETMADMQKTQIETANLQFDLAAKSGQLNAVIQDAVARALMGVMVQQTQGQQAPQPFGQGPL